MDHPPPICWKCSKPLSDTTVKIGFRATCPHCDRDLHVCKNCRYYSPGKPNDCIVPGTEVIRDREAANFCEEFKPLVHKQAPQGDQARRILGEPEKKKNFKSLFKDEDS